MLGQQQQQGKAFSFFINSLRAEQTKKQYTRWLNDYMKFIGITKYDNLLTHKDTQQSIIEFVMNLRGLNLSRSNISSHVSAIKHFYSMNDILSINWDKINKFKGEEKEQDEDRPYRREEIKQLIDNALSLRDKAMISLLSSSGMRKGGLIDLRIKDLLQIEKYNIYRVTVYARAPARYYTFCTPETKKYINDYLGWRSRLGEKIDDNTILFRKEFDIRDSFAVRNNVKKLTLSGVTSIFRELSYDIGIRKCQHLTEEVHSGQVKHEVMLIHGLRKYFDTTCTGNGMDKLYIEYCMGHDIGLKGSYYKPTWKEVLEGNDRMRGYISVINDLTINEENRLRKQVAEQEHTIQNKLAEKDKQIEKMMRKQEQFEKLIQSLIDSRQLKPLVDYNDLMQQ